MAKEPRKAPTSTTEDVLEAAIQQTNAKGRVHGDTEPSFRMIAELWSVYISHLTKEEVVLKAKDVAYLMNLLKVARALYGSNDSLENEVDGAGYLALAAMLRKGTTTHG